MTEQSFPAAGGADKPQAQVSAGSKGLGGWLILPMLGTILSPLWLAYQVLQTTAALERATSSSLKVFVAGEVLFNLGLMVAWVVAIFLLFKRKRSYPRLFVTLVALTFLGNVCDLAIAVGVFNMPLDADDFKSLARQFWALAIWGPYMIISKRVRNTFVE